jgi:hypothetical protein
MPKSSYTKDTNIDRFTFSDSDTTRAVYIGTKQNK